MAGIDNAVVLLIEFLCGGAAGIFLGRKVPGFSMGRLADGVIGGIGGLLFVWPTARIPGVGRLIGHLADGVTPTMLAGAAIAGLAGGVILTLLAGFVRYLAAGR